MERILGSEQADRVEENHRADHVMPPEGAEIDITAAEPVGEYRLRLSFSDGTVRIADFEPFLRSSSNPLIRTYLDPERFANFRIEYGELVWDDYGLCFPIADLYENRI
jgi:hypothetical protein